jgi:hypothetical protein
VISRIDVVDNVEDEVVKIFSSSYPSSPTSSRNIFILVVRHRLITPRCKLLADRFDVLERTYTSEYVDAGNLIDFFLMRSDLKMSSVVAL